MEHSELVAEMPLVERMGTQERLALARRRRLQQLKLWSQKDKEWSRSQRGVAKDRSRRIYFSNSVMLLEAAARNDVDEGKQSVIIIHLKLLLFVYSQRRVVICNYEF